MLQLDRSERDVLWRKIVEAIEDYAERVGEAPVAPRLEPEKLRGTLAEWSFDKPVAPEKVVAFAVQNLWENQLHVPHPGYFGMFNPAPSTMGRSLR